MNRKIKIAYIGGGSKQWARVFMSDLLVVRDFAFHLLDASLQFSAMVNVDVSAELALAFIVFVNLNDGFEKLVDAFARATDGGHHGHTD